MTMRLIDADALGEKLEALMQKYAAAGKPNVAQDYNFVLTVIECAPTADAAEVRRGKVVTRWLWNDWGPIFHGDDMIVAWMPLPDPIKGR